MSRILSALFIGLIFGSGIAVSGMINPAKVLNFFDFFGTWDPSLAFVMGGALIITAIGYFFILKRPAPLLDKSFHLPLKQQIDRPLIAGSAIFGIGWGIGGFCPGGSIPALGLMQTDVYILVASMITGILIARFMRGKMQC
ncbi:DUF6691 family protein [Paenochrobactrum sp. BZR 588]|uniref:DUF6691 family protein n=1 Tax=Paenochrobactrum TaxID=999488 RepID=UPI0035BC5A73